MGAFAADDGGLIGAFHVSALREKSLVLERFAPPAVKVNQLAIAVDNSTPIRVQYSS
jgi:hypothetical protein